MTYPTIIIIYLFFIIILEVIQVAALLYYIWSLCLRPSYQRYIKNKYGGLDVNDTKVLPLIQMMDYIDL